MTINAMFNKVLAMGKLDIPKRETDDRVRDIFGDLLEDHGDRWQVNCFHRSNPGANGGEIRKADVALGFVLPEQLDCLLQIANGAQLFVAHRLGLESVFPGTFHVRYRVLDTNELVCVNKELLEFFRIALGDDPDFREFKRLNYLAFCDVADGNYLAILLEGQSAGKVFYLDRELCARPYRERDSDMYYTLADSLAGWLGLLCETGGWAGRGMMTGGF